MHRERAHLKVPGFSIVLNALLTRKLPTFLSRFKEISGGCEKIAPVLGSFGQVANVAVLLRLLGSLYRQPRLRAYPNGHGQYVLCPFVRRSGRSSKARTSEGV